MKHLAFDSLGGAAGNMILASLVDLGVSVEELQRDLAALPIGPFSIDAQEAEDRHLRGIRVVVRCPASGNPHRGLGDIEAIIEKSGLPPEVRQGSAAVFRRLAEAEAHVHGTTPDKIHFHEVGAVDSIVDIVGGCLGLHLLGVDTVSVGPLPLGRGVIACAHGLLPSPSPATLELLKGFPVEQTDEPFELVTPTGAALLTSWATRDAVPAGSRLSRVGYALGMHPLRGRSNLLRATLYDGNPAFAEVDECLALECNLDDTTPELIGVLMSRCMEAGALDAFATAIQMKKQRPGTLLTVLCRAPDRDVFLDLIFRESTTLGIREYMTRRSLLARRVIPVATAFGEVRIKIGTWKGEDIVWAPEMDDCLVCARERGVAVRAVYDAARDAAAALKINRN